EGGKNGRDLIKDLFKALTLRVVVQPIMGALQGMVTNTLGGMLGFQNPQGGGPGLLGMAQNVNTLYQATSGGMAANLGHGLGWIWGSARDRRWRPAAWPQLRCVPGSDAWHVGGCGIRLKCVDARVWAGCVAGYDHRNEHRSHGKHDILGFVGRCWCGCRWWRG